MDALPGNTFILRLDCSGNDVTPALAGRLLRAARANATLRSLIANERGNLAELAEAEALVAARAAAAAAAAGL